MKLNVPYYSQYLDVTNTMWQPRACGIACLKMILDTDYARSLTLDEMIDQGCAIGAHGEYGWKHAGLVALARQYGTKLSRAEWRHGDTKSQDELNEEGIQFLITHLRSGRPAIVSAIKKFQEADKFHMMVLTGFEEKEGVVIGFYYHDSDFQVRGEGENLFVSIDTFRSKWRRMAIF